LLNNERDELEAACPTGPGDRTATSLMRAWIAAPPSYSALTSWPVAAFTRGQRSRPCPEIGYSARIEPLLARASSLAG